MAMLTLADARTHLFDSYCVGDNDPHPDLAAVGVAGVYDVELPGGDIAKPVAVTLFSTGYTPTEFNFEIRVYSSLDEGAAEAQYTLDAVLPIMDDLLPGNTGPENWLIVFDETLNAFIATSTVNLGREDFNLL